MVNYEIVKEKFSMEVRGAEWNEVMEKISAL
jgi:hypothetical protein